MYYFSFFKYTLEKKNKGVIFIFYVSQIGFSFLGT